MFKKSIKHTQGDLFCGIPSILEGKSLNQYNNEEGWHNQFRKQIVSRIDEPIFKVLYDEKMGAPNSSVSVLVGMMILKDAFGWSDLQLFEHCRFNLLVRSALGLFNLNDEIPTDSTYYLFRQRIHEYNRLHHEDLLQKTFELITQQQIKDFEVNGKSIRMDSKLIGSNIAYFSRYEIIHQTFTLFCKTLNDSDFILFSEDEKQQLKSLLKEEPLKTIYRSTKEDIQTRMQSIGILVYKTLHIYSDQRSEPYKLLQRVFQEQYKVEEENQEVLLRPKEEIVSGSVQSPHDPDSAYRQKADQKVKGYSVNVTETISDGPLNLITNVIVDKANVPDTIFVQPAISATQAITGMQVEKVYSDGAFQSPDNDEYCQNIDMVFTGIQGAVSRYDLGMTPDGLQVTDTQTGKCLLATLAKKLKNSKEDKWFIGTGKDKVYFNQHAIRTSNMRRIMKQRPLEETQKRNNVESTIFHVGYPLRNSKSKYRGLIKNQVWAICRCLWVNLVRIIHFLEQTCQRTAQKLTNEALLFNLQIDSIFQKPYYRKLTRKLAYFVFVYFFSNFNQL
jgi:uncharacterized protein YeaC (DUF1315 family)